MQYLLYYLCINIGMGLIYLAERGHRNTFLSNVGVFVGTTTLGIPLYIYWLIFRR